MLTGEPRDDRRVGLCHVVLEPIVLDDDDPGCRRVETVVLGDDFATAVQVFGRRQTPDQFGLAGRIPPPCGCHLRAGLARPWLVNNYRSAANLNPVYVRPASTLPGP